MTKMLVLSACLAVLASTAARPARASDTLPANLLACADIADASQRLACFDRIVADARAAGGARPSGPAAVAAAAAPAAAPVLTPEQKFGATGELARKQAPPPEARDQSLDSLSSQVVELHSTPTGELVVKLENGQVWRQVYASPMLVRAGDKVTIKPAAFGSFWMTDPSGRGSRVKRIQ